HTASVIGQQDFEESSGPAHKDHTGKEDNRKSVGLTNLNSHFNSTYGGPIESTMEISGDFLNSKNHSAVTFKENGEINNTKPFGVGDTIEREKWTHLSKGRASTRVPLIDSMSSMAKLISSQIQLEFEKGCLKSTRVDREEHKPDIIGLLETRISGSKADLIIDSLGFQHSHRVKQLVFDSTTQRLIFVVFVYGSHDSQKCKKLWRDLKGSIPNYDFPWMVIGDFNAIELLVKRKVGKSGVFERLDRAIGNYAWLASFLNYSVTHLPRLKSDHKPLLVSLRPQIHSPLGRSFCFLARRSQWNCLGESVCSWVMAHERKA
ncbi:hypothetical protein Gorai_013472, partial [Gossypium raimondii]|nr:hypothetical protein [Gossypium raimondii]